MKFCAERFFDFTFIHFRTHSLLCYFRKQTINTVSSICRYLVLTSSEVKLCGTTPLQRTEVNFLNFQVHPSPLYFLANTTSMISHKLWTLYTVANLLTHELVSLQVDHWLEFSSGRLNCSSEFIDAIQYLDTVLAGITFLVGNDISLADYAVWGTLRGNQSLLFLSSYVLPIWVEDRKMNALGLSWAK